MERTAWPLYVISFLVCFLLPLSESLAGITSADAEVFTHKIVSPPDYHTTGLIQDETYAAAGVTTDPDTGDPIDPPEDWSYSYSQPESYGDLAGMAQAWAAPGELKGYLHLYAHKQLTPRVKMEARTRSQYEDTIRFECPDHPEFWAGNGLEHTVQLEFRVTGNIQENDISGSGVKSNVNLQLYSDSANPPELEGEGYGWEVLISDSNASHNDVDENGNYDKTASYQYKSVDAEYNQSNQYNGEDITFSLLLWLSAEQGDIDRVGEGDVVMDFTNTCVLESASLYEDAGEERTLLVQFDQDGNAIGGTQSNEWVLVPEPGSLILLAVGASALLRRRRQRRG